MSAGKEITPGRFLEPLHCGTQERMEERTESQVSESLFGPPRFLFIYFFSQMPKILNHRTIFEHFQSKTPAGDTFPVHIDFIIIMIFLFYVQ